jgi:hypothetical protein
MGYCPGRGLREYLLENGVSPQEAESSPLFHPVAGTENFTGRITLADRDFTGAALWMTSTIPEEPGEKHAWRRRRPGTYGIPGRRGQLLNLHSITAGNPGAVVTDDLRLYAVLAVNHTPAALIAQRRQNGRDTLEECRRMAGALRNRGLQRAVIAVHDREHRERLAEALADLLPGGEILVHSQDAIMAALAPHTRDLERFTGPAKPGGDGEGPGEGTEALGPEEPGPEALGPEEPGEDLEELQPEELREGPEGGPRRAYPSGGGMGWTPSTRSPRLSR